DLVFYTSDGILYYLDSEETPWLAITDQEHNLVLQNLDSADHQFAKRGNYYPDLDQANVAIAALTTKRFNLYNLQLKRYNEELSFFEIPTGSYQSLNQDQLRLVEAVYGQSEEDLAANMKMLKQKFIGKTKMWIVNPEYVQKYASQGPLARVSWLNDFTHASNFNADCKTIYQHMHVRGVRRKNKDVHTPKNQSPKLNAEMLSPTKANILMVSAPYVCGFAYSTFTEIVPEDASAADVLVPAHDLELVADHSWAEFEEKIRALYKK
ncbi:MAG: hypothetical protein AABX31_04150, partial [Nanoarchaeota archaeon]